MKLSILTHVPSEDTELISEVLGLSRYLRNFSYMGNWSFPVAQTDLYISSVNMQVAATSKFFKTMPNYKRVFLDLGMSPTSLELAMKVMKQVLESRPATQLGFVQPQSILLKSLDAYKELFPSKSEFPVSIIGNGIIKLESQLETLAEMYPKAIPCVMFVTSLEQNQLGQLLVKYWNVFSELIFWSETTLYGIDLYSIANDILPLRQKDNMRYIALRATTIREGRSLGARGIGQTLPGQVYLIKEVYREDTPQFAKLEDGTYVVFDENYFSKEIDTI